MKQADDVCGFEQPQPPGAVGNDGLVDIPAQHPDIFYMGRIACRDPGGPRFSYPGVSIRARFEGDALDMRLQDFGGGTERDTNFYDVSIDDGAPILLEVSPQQRIYPLARQLGPGPHHVEIFKRVEANAGSGSARFLGFRLRQGARLLTTRGRPRRLEFVGDSITCGYGNELSTNDPSQNGYTTRNSNAHLAYGALVSRELNAEYVAVAASGRGVSRNYADEPAPLIPELHRRTLPDSPTPVWDHRRYRPDAVVINLGTNDYSTPGVDRELFRNRYREFLEFLRAEYPKTALVVTLGPMLQDDEQAGRKPWTEIREDVARIVSARKRAGDPRLHYHEFIPQQAPFGEDWHPTVATHRRMARELSARLRDILGWR